MTGESRRSLRKQMQNEIARLRQGIADMRDMIVAEAENCDLEGEIGSLANRIAIHLLHEHKDQYFLCKKCDKESSKNV